MKILKLTLKKKWFDLIAKGEKTIEYREYKPYWENRLVGKGFQEVHFRNGYRKNSPFMRVECRSIIRVLPHAGLLSKPKHGEKLNGWQFAIHLGKVLEVEP